MYIIIHDGKTIKHIEEIGHDFTKENVEVVAETPPYVPQEGKYAVLEWDETEGLVYRYYDIPEDEAE